MLSIYMVATHADFRLRSGNYCKKTLFEPERIARVDQRSSASFASRIGGIGKCAIRFASS